MEPRTHRVFQQHSLSGKYGLHRHCEYEPAGPQQEMFQVADNISQTAFYIAADDWTQKPGEEWKVTKRYGAFHNAVAFTTSMLKKSTNPCFYEII
jgi:hypothetical protein